MAQEVEKKETIIDLKTIDSNSYKHNNLSVNQTKDGLEVAIKANNKGSITIHADKYWDLTEWVFLSLELENKTDTQVRFDPIILYDNPKRGNPDKKVKNKYIGFLQPRESLDFNCVLIRDKKNIEDYPQAKDFPQMKGMPGGVILNFDGIDAKRIKGIQIIFPAQETAIKVVVKRLFKNRNGLPELYTKNKNDFFPFINKYGQYKHGAWEGKITNDSQFSDAINKEEADLKAHKGSAEWNEFGGFKKGPQFEATGNFRTQKVNGKWWIIDPRA